MSEIKNKYLYELSLLKESEDHIHVWKDRILIKEIVNTMLLINSTYEKLLTKLDNMRNIENYDVYLVMLYLTDEDLYNQRIKRDKHQYQKFEAESSIIQQREYLKMADEVKENTKNIKVICFPNDNEEIFEENIKKYFGEYLK
jgi:hypothetical protein